MNKNLLKKIETHVEQCKLGDSTLLLSQDEWEYLLNLLIPKNNVGVNNLPVNTKGLSDSLIEELIHLGIGVISGLFGK